MIADDLSRVLMEARRRLAVKVLQAGLILQGQAKVDYSTSNPRPHTSPAPKGSFPRGRTWNLRDSIAISPTTISEIELTLRIRVGYLPGAAYGAILKAKGWKGIQDSYAACEPQIRQVLGV